MGLIYIIASLGEYPLSKAALQSLSVFFEKSIIRIVILPTLYNRLLFRQIKQGKLPAEVLSDYFLGSASKVQPLWD